MAEGGRKRVASVLAVDMAGYSSRAETDAGAATSAVSDLHARVRTAAATHDGRVFSTAGDGLMCEFAAASEAVAAAQDILTGTPRDAPPARIGVHIGEVYEQENGDLLGHGVNVAARLEQLAAPGTALISRAVADMVQGDLRDRLVRQGQVALDKLNESVEAFVLDPAAKRGHARRPRRKRALLIVGVLATTAILVAGAAALWSAGFIGPSREQRVQAALRDPEVTRALILQLAGGDGQIPRDATLQTISALQGSALPEDLQAFSFLRRGETDAAVNTLENYAATLLQQGRHEEAASAFGRASDLAQLLTPERALALARRAFAADPASMAAFERAANMTRRVEGYDAGTAFCLRTAETADDVLATFARLLAVGNYAVSGRVAEANTLLEAAAPGVARHPDYLLLQHTDAWAHALTANTGNNVNEARRQITRARAFARRLRGEEFRGDVTEVSILFNAGDFDGAWRASRAAIAQREANGWPASQSLLYSACVLGILPESLAPARLAEAARYCRAAGAAATDPIMGAFSRGSLALAEERFDDALREIESVALLPQTTAQPMDALITEGMRAELALRSGDFAGSERRLPDMRRLAEPLSDGRTQLAEIYRRLGAIEIQQGRRAPGCAKFAEAVRLYREVRSDAAIEAVTRFMRANNCPRLG
jgi:class 3 adenylate cyclase